MILIDGKPEWLQGFNNQTSFCPEDQIIRIKSLRPFEHESIRLKRNASIKKTWACPMLRAKASAAAIARHAANRSLRHSAARSITGKFVKAGDVSQPQPRDSSGRFVKRGST